MKNTKITKEQVKEVTKLSNLDLSDSDVTKMSELLTDTLEHINVLDELDVSQVAPTSQVTGLKNVFMEGSENEVTLSREDALSNAAKSSDGLFSTKAVFDRDQS